MIDLHALQQSLQQYMLNLPLIVQNAEDDLVNTDSDTIYCCEEDEGPCRENVMGASLCSESIASDADECLKVERHSGSIS